MVEVAWFRSRGLDSIPRNVDDPGYFPLVLGRFQNFILKFKEKKLKKENFGKDMLLLGVKFYCVFPIFKYPDTLIIENFMPVTSC